MIFKLLPPFNGLIKLITSYTTNGVAKPLLLIQTWGFVFEIKKSNLVSL
jgi:hypothetical protein